MIYQIQTKNGTYFTDLFWKDGKYIIFESKGKILKVKNYTLKKIEKELEKKESAYSSNSCIKNEKLRVG